MQIKFFDFRDLFLTPRISLSWKKLSVHLTGIFTGWFAYSIVTYIALIINGSTLKQLWQRHYLFPCIFNTTLPIQWYVYLISGIGILIWIFIYSFSSTAISRITLKQFKGNNYFSTKESFLFAKKHIFAPILAPITISLIILFFILIFFIAGLITKFPILDIMFLGFPFILHFIAAVFVIYTLLVFSISLMLSSAIVGTAEEDTLETVFQSYSSFWNQPWRIVIYEIINLSLALFATYIFAWINIFAYKLLNVCFSFSIIANEKIQIIVKYATSFIYGEHSPISPLISFLFRLSPDITKFSNQINLSVTERVSTFFVGISLFLILFIVFAYFLVNLNVGNSIIYLLIRKHKDDENLIERKDEDELVKNEVATMNNSIN